MMKTFLCLFEQINATTLDDLLYKYTDLADHSDITVFLYADQDIIGEYDDVRGHHIYQTVKKRILQERAS